MTMAKRQIRSDRLRQPSGHFSQATAIEAPAGRPSGRGEAIERGRLAH
jgi:hypothetical protein